ncbi:uncharacterized protein METZ01_LOCUS434666, partial [marine metagenome]
MAFSRARYLARILNTSGRVRRDRTQATGGTDVFTLDSLPTIPNAKLANSVITIGGVDVALGGDADESTTDLIGAMVTGGTENGISVTYDDTNNRYNFDVNDPVITLGGDLTGNATITNLGNTTLTATVVDDSHAHVIGNIDDFTEEVQDIVGDMVASNTETGITVTYQD